ncbi:hypothetical protein IM538_05475 [Cytobacillus suaedae]|nr:hypothetical protein IM538_05475 [Cytobacillus suaedae]
MFVAKKNDGVFISLLDSRPKEDLIQMRKEFSFFCSACQHPVQMKLGEKRLPHFAHLKDSKCITQTENETPYHLEGKKQLYSWLRDLSGELELEPFIPAIKQRPDLLIKVNNEKFAIEFQCSQLSYEHLRKRTKAYKSINIYPLWILGESWLKTDANPLFSLSPFQWLFATIPQSKNSNCFPSILYFNPMTKIVTKMANLIPFSPTQTFATIQKFTPNNSLIEVLTTSLPLNPQMVTLWLEKKKHWRYQFTMFPDNKLNPIFLALYTARITRASVPAEAGLPFPTVYFIETSAVIWQLWILLDSIIPVTLKAPISFDSTYRLFNKRVDEGHIKIRRLPNIEGQHYSFAIMDYLQVLTKLGILKRINARNFIKVNEIILPQNGAEALEVDKAVLKKLYGW